MLTKQMLFLKKKNQNQTEDSDILKAACIQ